MAIWLFYSCIVTLYQVTDTSDEARDLMFVKSKSPESLPPTSDALKLHIERAHFQASVWKQANVVKPDNLAFLQLHRNVIQPVEH
jgi:hypothetical protein